MALKITIQAKEIKILNESEFDIQNELDITLEPNSKLTYITANKNTKRTAQVHKDATITWIDLNLSDTNSSIRTKLVEEGASGYLYGLFIGKEKEKLKIYNETEHQASNTKSTWL